MNGSVAMQTARAARMLVLSGSLLRLVFSMAATCPTPPLSQAVEKRLRNPHLSQEVRRAEGACPKRLHILPFARPRQCCKRCSVRCAASRGDAGRIVVNARCRTGGRGGSLSRRVWRKTIILPNGLPKPWRKSARRAPRGATGMPPNRNWPRCGIGSGGCAPTLPA